MGMKQDKAPVLLAIVATSVGEVDWLLPVLVAFKRKHPEWQIISVFGHKLVYQKLAQNPELFAAFSKISSLNVVPQELEALFSQNISPEQVQIILKDFNRDEFAPYKTVIEDRCPEALVVSYPHSNYIYSNRTSEPLRHPADPDAYSRHDLFLLSSPHDIPFWSRHVDSRKIRTFGYPVFDEQWSRRLLDSPLLKESEEYARAQQAGRVFFHVSRHPHAVYLADGDYRYLNEALLEQVFAYDDSFLLIKPHPRQDLEEFARLLERYDSSRWMFSGLHLTQLCSLADVVVSYWSSGILNALSVNKPVIEFYRFGSANPEWRKLPDGGNTSIYRELGLAVPADSAEELRVQIRSALDGSDPVWQFQQKAFRLHCSIGTDASAAIVDRLIEESERKRSGPVAEAVHPTAGVGEQIRQVEKLVADGEMEAARTTLDRLVAEHPDDPEVLNDYGVFLFNQGEFLRAVDTLVKCLTLSPHDHEAAGNLIQMLIELERQEEAAELAINFYREASDNALREQFLYGLAGRLAPDQFAALQKMIGEQRPPGGER